MPPYDPEQKNRARQLRANQTEAEKKIWSRLRRKQIGGVQFYRQKPIGPYIVDFCAPAAGLVIELDGSQHTEKDRKEADRVRDLFLKDKGLKVLRFNSRQAMAETDGVVEVIYRHVTAQLPGTNPP